MRKRTKCEGCDGSGIRPYSNQDRPHAGTPPKGFVIIEKCDSCDKYPSDLAAAKAWGRNARWQNGSGTSQAIARPKAASHEEKKHHTPLPVDFDDFLNRILDGRYLDDATFVKEVLDKYGRRNRRKLDRLMVEHSDLVGKAKQEEVLGDFIKII